MSEEAIIRDYELVLKFLDKRHDKSKDDQQFIKLVFSTVQEIFLHRYDQYASFSEVLTGNAYDCATATALYASFFIDLDIEFEIWETNYHTYIKIKSEKGPILLETTDSINGFVTGIQAEALESRYLSDNMEGCLYENDINIHGRITPEEFIGLLYFNQAVKSYNDGNILKALGQILQAEMKYPSERVFFLKGIIMDRVTLGSTSSI